VAAFLIELAVLVIAGYYLLAGYNKRKRHIILVILLSAGFLSMFFAPEAEATPVQASIASLSLYAVFAALAFWSEREVKRGLFTGIK
jgi:hypothetical protein